METSWVWLGDHLAVDFVNTVRVVDGQTVELISTQEEFASLYRAEPARLPRAEMTRESMVSLLILRNAALRLVRAAARREPLNADDVATINKTVRAGNTRRVLGTAVGSSTLEAADDFPSLAGVLASAIVDLLAREDLANIAVCYAPGCGQIFHRSRPNQAWCSAGCGNRARVDRHRHRKTGTAKDRAQGR